MIATAIPHSAFDKPGCRGRLDIVGRAGFIVDFVCHECGATVACARDEDMSVALQILNFAAGLTSIHCLRCGFESKRIGVEAIYAFVCRNCQRSSDLIAPKETARKRPDAS